MCSIRVKGIKIISCWLLQITEFVVMINVVKEGGVQNVKQYKNTKIQTVPNKTDMSNLQHHHSYMSNMKS